MFFRFVFFLVLVLSSSTTEAHIGDSDARAQDRRAPWCAQVKQRTRPLLPTLRGSAKKPHRFVTLSEVSALLREALTQSKACPELAEGGPYCSSTADPPQGISLSALNIVRMPFWGPHHRKGCRDPSPAA